MSDMTQVYLEVGKLSKVDLDIWLLDLVESIYFKDKQYQQNPKQGSAIGSQLATIPSKPSRHKYDGRRGSAL